MECRTRRAERAELAAGPLGAAAFVSKRHEISPLILGKPFGETSEEAGHMTSERSSTSDQSYASMRPIGRRRTDTWIIFEAVPFVPILRIDKIRRCHSRHPHLEKQRRQGVFSSTRDIE